MELMDFMSDIQHAEVLLDGVGTPQLHVFIGHEEFEPRQSKMNFRILSNHHRDMTIYFGEDGIFCTGYYHDHKREFGYGGAEFYLPGIDRTIKGPWSSRPSVYMAYGAPQYMEVIIHRNHPFVVGMKIDAVHLILDHFCKGYELVFEEKRGEYQWEIVAPVGTKLSRNSSTIFPAR